MVIFTPPPPTPQRGDRSTFSSRVDAFLTWLITKFIPELIGLQSNLTSVAAGGAYAIPYIWGGGINAGQADSQSVTNVLGITNVNSAGQSVLPLLQQFDASSSAVKGQIRIVAASDSSRWLVFNVTSRSDSGSFQIVRGGVVQATGNNPFIVNELVLLYFQRTGDKGENGPIQAPTLYVREERASGTASATPLVAGTLVKRSLNAVKINTISSATVASDVVTLPAGTYEYDGTAPAVQVGVHKAALVNTSDNITDYGTVVAANVGTAVANQSVLRGTFTITSTKNFELRHIGNSSGSGGTPGSFGSTEVYAEIRFKKVA